MQNPVFFVYIAVGVIFAAEIALAVFLFLLKKKLNLFFKRGGENLEDALANQIRILERQEKDIEKIFEEIKRLSAASKRSFQKIGVVRFNPFKEVGGNQSFSVALLDDENNGFVLTGLYERENCRVYAKPIEKAQSQYPLSREEIRAVEEAIGLQNAKLKNQNAK